MSTRCTELGVLGGACEEGLSVPQLTGRERCPTGLVQLVTLRSVAPERTVKITISIPASLFDGADRLARRRGVPRSRLYAEALQRYVDEDSDSEVTRQLDELADEMDTSMDPVVKELQRRSLARNGG